MLRNSSNREAPKANGSAPQPLGEYWQEEIIARSFAEAHAVLTAAEHDLPEAISTASAAIYRCFAAGGKLLVCGNGGSAADAQHFVAELVGRFKVEERPGLPAIALTADSALLTAWANDVGYDDVFARQVEAYGRPGDLLLVLSTTGNSPNVIHAMETARYRQLKTIALLGGSGGHTRLLADIVLLVPPANTQRTQETHLLLLHLLAELVEERLEMTARPAAADGQERE